MIYYYLPPDTHPYTPPKRGLGRIIHIPFQEEA